MDMQPSSLTQSVTLLSFWGTVAQNTAAMSAGGLYVRGSVELALAGSSVANNTALDGQGGGLFAETANAVSVESVRFVGNRVRALSGQAAAYGGGGLSCDDCPSVDIRSSSFVSNGAEARDSARPNLRSETTVKVRIELRWRVYALIVPVPPYASPQGYAGAFKILNSTSLMVDGCAIFGNTARGRGGGFTTLGPPP